MDILQQTKLTREEWLSIEKPVSQDEKRILELIRDGYQNVNHKTNYTQNMFGYTQKMFGYTQKMFGHKKNVENTRFLIHWLY